MRLASNALPGRGAPVHIGDAACAAQSKTEHAMNAPRIAKLMLLTAVTCALNLGQASAAGPSEASAALSGASLLTASLVGAGSAQAIAKGGDFVVKAIDGSGRATVVVLRSASDAGEFSVRLAGQAAGAASLAVGTSVKVVADATGHALMVAGKLVAYVPNEVGRALLHQSRVKHAH